MSQNPDPIFTAILFSVLLVLIAIISERSARLIRRMQLQIVELDRAAHVTFPGQEFSAAYLSGCGCAACHTAEQKSLTKLLTKTSSGPLEDDRPVGEVLPPGVSPTAPTTTNPTVRIIMTDTASKELDRIRAQVAELYGVRLEDVGGSAVRVHLRGSTVPCTDVTCRRPHRLVDGPAL